MPLNYGEPMPNAQLTPPSHVLLAEGRDETHVVRHLLLRKAQKPNFCMLDKQGMENLLDGIALEAALSDRKTVGIAVDADDNPDDRWRSVAGRLQAAALAEKMKLPAKPKPRGAIIDSRPAARIPRIGIRTMPDNQSEGQLEDFIADMIPDDDPVWPQSVAYIKGIRKEDRKFKPNKKSRAKVNAWLATREAPRPMGLAIKAQDLNVDGDNCRAFWAWLHRLFPMNDR